MILNREAGGYARGVVVRMFGSFQTNATAAPTVIRDGHSTQVVSVTRISAGLYEVTFDTGFPVPELMVTERAWKNGSATPTIKGVETGVVVGSWTQSTRKFRIICNTAAAGAADPDTGDRINFELVGSISSPGTDLA